MRDDLRRRLGRLRPWEEGFDFTPPAVPPDLATGPPDFVGVGASFCGVRWWYGLLVQHPGIADAMTRPMGLHYFSHFSLRSLDTGAVDRYHRWFPRPAGSLVGEWTVEYAAQLWVAPLLAQAAPDARLLILVRDPVERFQLGLTRAAPARAVNVGAAVADVIDGGFYGVQLRRLREFFPAERILVLQLERCRLDVDGQLASTFRFLGLDDSFLPPRSSVHPPGPAPPPDPDVAGRLAELYAEDAVELSGLVPGVDLELWPAVADACLR